MFKPALIAPHRHPPCAAVLACFVLFWNACSVYSLPEDYTVESGTVSSEKVTPERLLFNVQSEKAVLHFNRFDVAPSETVEFHHEDLRAGSSVLSRVTGGSFSTISGTLISNGQLLLVNPAGIVFTPSAQVMAASFIASTLNIETGDFLAGRLEFKQAPDFPPAEIIQEGRILISPGGLAALLGGSVTQKGFIVAEIGSVALATGKKITLSLDLKGGLAVAVDEPLDRPAVSADGKARPIGIDQKGTIEAPGGQVFIEAKSVPRLFDRLVNQDGFIEATRIAEQGGRIELLGEGGAVIQTGTLKADASGEAGDGGSIVIFSNEETRVTGHLSARGGTKGGGGGFADTSSRGILQVETAPDLSSPFGRGGLWLLDPRNITITSSTSNVTEGGGDPDTFTPTANNATVNVSAINTALNNGTSVTVNTNNASGSQQGNIKVSSAISKTSGGDATLLLTAANDITVSGAISSTSGLLHITLTADDDASGAGDVSVNAALATNGGNFTSTGRDFSSNASGSITTAGGNFTVNHTRDVTTGAAVNAGAGVVDIDAGRDITLNGSVATTTGNIFLDAPGATSDISISQPMTSTSGNITLNASDGVLLSGASADLSTAGTYTVNADTDAGDNNGDYNQNNAGSSVSITNNSISITADDFKLTGTLSAGSGSISILSSDSGTIRLGSGSGNMVISGAELQNITAGALTIGNATNGNITVNNITAANSNNISGVLTLNATGPAQRVTFSGNPSTFNALAVNAGDGITLSEDVTTGSGSFTANADSDASGAGTFTVASGVTLSTSGGSASITAADVALSGSVNAGAGDVSFLPSTAAAIGLGTGSGSFALTDAELDLVTTTGTLTIGNSSSGAITLGDLTQGAKNISLISGSTINDDDDAGSSLTTTGTLTLASNGAIGNLGGPAGLHTDVATLAVTSTGGNNITLSNVGTTNLTLSGVATGGAGNINITQSANDLFVGSVSTTGSVTLTASAGSIEESGADAAADILGDAATLSAAAGIGSLGTLETAVNSLSATVTGNGGIDISEENDLNVGSLSASGSVALSVGGNLLDGNGSALNVTAGANSSLTAAGIIGTVSDPLDVSVIGGSLSVGPRSQVNGVAGVLSGTVSPGNTLGIIGAPPGAIFFNDQPVFELPLTAGTLNAFFGQLLSSFFAPESQRRARSVAS